MTDVDADEADDPLLRVARSHVEHRTVVIPEFKVLYAPVPKTGWTTMLWALAELAGLAADEFDRSTKPEISATMAVHDEAVWSARGLVLGSLNATEREYALGSTEWMRFSVVREPARRLWSAWQSKLLLREPVYYGFHHARPWYPRRPSDPLEVMADFHAFVRALAAGFGTDSKMRDPHWGRQVDVVAQLPLTHVGRAERLGETEALLRAHVAREGGPPLAFGRDNAMPLPYEPALVDGETAEVVTELYGPDFEAFGYSPPPILRGAERDAALRECCAGAAAQLPWMNELIDRHERLYAVTTEYRGRLARAEREGRRSAAEAAAVRAEAARLQARNRRLTESLSWRVTAPLRRIRARAGRNRRTP
jgi:Sulfotransferase family